MLWRITLPGISPALVSGWLLAFTLSLDDLVVASFVSGPSATTLPMAVYSSVRIGVTPEINALATVFLAVVFWSWRSPAADGAAGAPPRRFCQRSAQPGASIGTCGTVTASPSSSRIRAPVLSGWLNRRAGRAARQRHPPVAMPGGDGDFGAQLGARRRRQNAERRPGYHHLGGDARLVGAEIDGFGAGDFGAAGRDRQLCGPRAEPGGHLRMIVQLGAGRDEEQREAPRAGSEIDAELDPVRVGERKGAVIGKQVDVEIILADRRQSETAAAPGQVGFAE